MPAAIDLVRTLATTAGTRRAAKSEVLRQCRDFEARLLADPPTRLVTMLQDVRFAAREARRVWAELARAGTSVTVFGRDVPAYVDRDVTGRRLADGDPLADVWALLATWPGGRAEAFLALDLDGRVDANDADDRTFAVCVSRDARWVVETVAALESHE